MAPTAFAVGRMCSCLEGLPGALVSHASGTMGQVGLGSQGELVHTKVRSNCEDNSTAENSHSS